LLEVSPDYKFYIETKNVCTVIFVEGQTSSEKCVINTILLAQWSYNQHLMKGT
jgi:hypothetical protein